MINLILGRFALLLLMILTATSCISGDCQQRENSVPEIPIYPSSTLLKESTILDSPSESMMSYEYEVVDSPESVAKFYMDVTVCSDINQENARQICRGQAEPFGIYYVYINFENADLTIYTIEVNWDKCSPNWEESIE
jgi:hypothetical protein